MEKLNKINPQAKNPANIGYGGLPELTAQDILLATVGCKEEYVALLLDMISYTNSGLVQEPQFTLKLENTIVEDLIKQYHHEADILERSRGPRKRLNDDELSIVVRCAICSKIQNMREDKAFADYLGVTVESYRSKYRETLNMCFKSLEIQLREVFSTINNRLLQ